MSEGYYNISSEYLLGPVASLGTLLTETDTKKIAQAKIKLNQNSIDAQNALLAFKDVESERFKKYIERRLAEVTSAYKDFTDRIEQETKIQIEVAVNSEDDSNSFQPSIPPSGTTGISATFNLDDF